MSTFDVLRSTFYVLRATCDVRGSTCDVRGSTCVVMLALSLASACSSPRESASPSLRPVSLPDLSKMAPTVQAQVRAAHAATLAKPSAPQAGASSLADAYGHLGKLLMAGDYREAAEPSFLNAQTLAPGDHRWPYYLGHLERDRGALPKAMAYFQQALALQPNDVATIVWLGDIHLAEGRPNDAQTFFEKALTLQPSSLSARFGLGRAALAKEEYQRAVGYLEEVLKLDPEAAAVHYPLAMAYQGLGKSAQADLHLRLREDHKILPADPLMVELEELLESPETFESRGIRALNAKDWPGAADLFRRGLALSPGHAALGHRLGTALFMMGDVAGAESQFKTVVKSSPDYAPAQYSLGVLLQERGRHADAIEHFSAALGSRTRYLEAQLRLAASLNRVGRAEESLQHYEQILAVDSNLTEARFGEAMAFVRLGRYREANDRLQQGMKSYPDQSVFAHGLARLLAASPDDRVRNGARALALLQEILKRDQRSLDLGETMAMALAETGRYEEAARIQRDLIKGADQAGLTLVRQRLARNLSLYERRQPCRVPWSDDEMP